MRRGLGFHARHSPGLRFSPEVLFTGGVQGAWYDPSDSGPTGTGGVGTLFSDRAGTTPCAAPGAGALVPVGLMLDKSAPIAASGYYSGVFDGTGDYLSVANNSAFGFGAGDFTIECWANFSVATSGVEYAIAFKGSSSFVSQSSWAIFRTNTNKLRFVFSSTGGSTNVGLISTTNDFLPTTGVWYHLAVSRQGTNFYIFINGVLQSLTVSFVGATTSSSAIFDSTTAVTIASTSDATYYFNGYLSNVRIVKGTAIYTGNFTPSTSPLTAVGGTSLLTCQNNYFKDNSTNNFAVTVNGNAAPNLFNPFDATAARTVNNAIAANDTTARPELSARVNLLTYSEQFDNGVWVKATNVTIAANTTATTDPLGGNTADKLISAPAGTGAQPQQVNQGSLSLSANTTYTFSVYVKAAGWNFVFFSVYTGVVNLLANKFNLSTGQLDSTHTTNAGTSTISDAGNGWYRIVGTFTTSTAVTVAAYVRTDPGAGNTFNWTGNGVDGAFVWGADLRVANIGTTIPAYQRVADQYTYDTVGFPRYLAFNGTSSAMSTPANIDFATVTSDGQARRNLLLNPTQFDASAWTLTNVTVTPNSAVAPDGTTTADLLQPTATSGSGTIAAQAQTITGAQGTYTVSYRIKPSGFNWAIVAIRSIAGSKYIWQWFNLASPAVGSRQTSVFTFVSASIVPDSNGYYVCTLTATTDIADSGVSTFVGMSDANNNLTATASGSNGILVWGAQLETGSTATAFQNIGTDKVTVFAGVRKLTPVGTANRLVELSSIIGSNNGSFTASAPDGGTTEYAFGSKGTVAAIPLTSSATYAAPITNVFTGIGDIGGDVATLRLNGVVVQTLTTDQGTGNFGSYPLFIGSRNNASQWLTGNIYSLTVVGSALTAGQIGSMEQYVAGKTGITI